jgi:hypothetical protein
MLICDEVCLLWSVPQSAIICLNLRRIPGFADALKGAPCGVRLPECLNGGVMAEMSFLFLFFCFLSMKCLGWSVLLTSTLLVI